MTFYCKCGHIANVHRADGNSDPYKCEHCGGEMTTKRPSIITKIKQAVSRA